MDKPIIFYDKPNGNVVTHFTQWDTNQELYTEKWDAVREPIFYFSNDYSQSALSVTSVYSGDFICVKIPNILFSEYGTLTVRVYQFSNEDSAKTLHIARFPIIKALIPDEYNYVENYKEISVVDLAKRITILENKVTQLENKIEELTI